jgi:phage shock protein C
MTASMLNRGAPCKLHRSSTDGLIAGVCAGLADCFGFDVTLVRVIVVVAAFFFPTVILVYLLLAVLLKKQPAPTAPGDADVDFRRRPRGEPRVSSTSLADRLGELDRRLQRIEKYVTSSRYELDREFDDLND